MSPRHKHELIASVAILGFLAAALFTGSWWVISTQKGAEWGFQQVGLLLPGKLEVREMSGPLKSPFEVRQLTYRTDRMEVTIDKLQVDWRLNQLLRRRLDIHRLYAEDVRVLVGASGDTPAERDSLHGPLPDVDLPVSILVRDGLVNHLQLTTLGSDSGLVIDRVSLDGTTFRDSLRVNHFVVRSRTLDVDLEGYALPIGNYPLALRGTWTMRPEGRPPFHGEGTFTGHLADTIAAVQQVTGPVAMTVDARVIRLLNRPRYEGEARFQDLHPNAIDPAWPEGTVSGRMHASGRFEDLVAEGNMVGRMAATGLTTADVRIRHVGGGWQVDRVSLMFPGTRARVLAHGVVTGDGPATRMRFDAEWHDVDLPLRGTTLLQSERGTARLAGTPQHFDVKLDALLAGRNLPPGKWYLDGQGGNGRLGIRTVIVDMLDGRITGSGTVAWTPRVDWRLGFEGAAINPGSVYIEWPGSIDFTARSEGTWTRRGPVGQVLVSRLGGSLRNEPLGGTGTLIARGQGYTLQDAAVQWGRDSVVASGDLIDRWSLTWRVAAPALAQLPQGSGALTASGTVNGPARRPRINVTAVGESLFYQRMHATSLRLAADVDLAPGGVLQVDAAANDVDVNDRSFARVTANARGTQAQHELRASVAGKTDSLMAAATGGIREGMWRGHLTTFDMVKRATGNWTLAAPAPLTASRERLTLADFAWHSGASRITVAADWSARGPRRFDARLDSVALALLQPVMPPSMRMTGTLEGRVMARTTAEGRLYADVDVKPSAGEISYLAVTGEWVPTRFENGVLRIGADGEGLDGVVALDLVNVGTVRGTMRMPHYAVTSVPSWDQPVDGKLSVHLRDLSLVQAFTPDLDKTGGALDAELAFAGTLARPAVQGEMHVKDATTEIPRLGLQLQQIAFNAVGKPDGHLALDGVMQSGAGQLTMKGTADMKQGGQPAADVQVKGDRVQAMNTRDSKVVVSPDLHFVLKGRRLDATGEVLVPEATVTLSRPEDQPAVRVSRDVVYAASDTLRRGSLDLYARVRMIVGDKVRVQGFGLDIRAEGSVMATDEPGLPTLGSGELTAREGTYRIYGQELAIDRGRLIFGGGPIDNPGVDARASRRADDGTVAGFEVKGTLTQPDVKVFSDPQRGQSQALAYIMFGRPIERGNLAQGQLVSTMATTMGLGGSELLAHGLASGLGIEQVRIQAGANANATSVMLGTHLSPKLYMSYGMGLFEATPAVQLRYVIDRRWTIEAEAAQQSRVDALFTIEK